MASDDFLGRKHSTSSHGIESPISPTSAQSRSNPLASKVSSVLSTSYTDSDVREALRLLDERGIENTPASRRQLRLDVQKDLIDRNGDIIKEFGHVAEQLKRIGLTIATLNRGCEEMKQHILAAHQETAPVLEESSDLMKQKEQVEAKQELLRAFNAHFIISDEDIAILTATAIPISDSFFAILSRTKKIQSDCEILLGTENQLLGSEIMAQTSKNINDAFQKLYRWIQREFKSLNLENPQISSSIRRALRVLAERPALFQNCLDFFAEAREHILTDAFYTALTGTSASGGVDTLMKPIELVAHDPLRYVGDMLAWTHSATVSEREALEVLFISDGDEIARANQAGRDSEPWNRPIDGEEGAAEFDGVKALNDLVDRDVAGVAKIVRQRIGQVIHSHEETIMAYKIANLLNFYRVTFSKLLGDDSALLESLTALEESALRQFKILMRDQVVSLQGEVQAAGGDLGPPEFLQDGLKQLTAIMKTYDTSLVSGEARESAFRPILVEALDPFVSGVEKLADGLKSPSNSIFLINCLSAITNSLSPFSFVGERISALQNSIEEYAQALTDQQYKFLRDTSGLKSLFEAFRLLSDSQEDVESIRGLDACRPHALTQASQILDDFLPSALMDAMENLRYLQNSRLTRQVTEAAAERFCEDFEALEEKLLAADAAWDKGEDGHTGEPLRTLFPRTSGEIRVLLS